MMGFGKRRDRRAFRELLAAYADGELDQATRDRVEAWLAESPAARDALEAQRSLSRHNRAFWRAAAAPGVSEGNWSRLFGRVQDALDAPMPATPPPNPRRWRYVVPIVSTAAAVAVAIFLARPGEGPAPAPPAGPATLEERLPSRRPRTSISSVSTTGIPAAGRRPSAAAGDNRSGVGRRREGEAGSERPDRWHDAEGPDE